MENNLPDLRDIHLPAEAVSFWPLAYGCWVVLFSVFLLLAGFFFVRFLLRKSKKRYALRLISSLSSDNRDNVVKMSELLRRICIYKYPRAATLFGQEWVAFLNNHSSKKLSVASSQLLLNAPYCGPTASFAPQEVKNLRNFCVSWIGENL